MHLDYDYFKYYIGSTFDVIQGNLENVENGMFPVTETFSNPGIYINKLNKTVSLISPLNSYIGRKYALRQVDCVTVCFTWHDNNKNTNLLSIYKNTSAKVFHKYYLEGIGPWLLQVGFTEVEDMIVGDILIYDISPNTRAHIAVYLGNNKILHHLPKKLSGIDNIDMSKVTGVYRYD